MDKEDEARPGRAEPTKEQKAAIAARALAFDPERYRHHIAHMNMSEEAQTELMAVVWRMMSSFVDIAFGHDATQLARIAGDKSGSGRESGPDGTLDSIHANPSNTGALSATFCRSMGSDGKECGVVDAAE